MNHMSVSDLKAKYHLERLDKRSFTPRDVSALNTLRLELKMSGLPAGATALQMDPLTHSDVGDTLREDTVVLVARESADRRIVGMGMLHTFCKWGHCVGWVEEVVTLEAWHRNGIGRAINIELITRARLKAAQKSI